MANINGLGPPQPTMTVSYKMDITTYGTHNGVFITTGIQSGGTNGVSPWGYFHAQQYPSGASITQVTGAGQPMIQAPPITPMPNQGFGGSTLNVSGASTTRSQPQIAGTSRSRSGSRSRSRSRPGSPDFDDSPPDEFLQPEKVQLNVFNPSERMCLFHYFVRTPVAADRQVVVFMSRPANFHLPASFSSG